MRRTRTRNPQQQRFAAGKSRGSAALGGTPLSPARKWLFRLLAVFVVPLLVLGGLELLLRLLGFGFDPHFFKRASTGGKVGYVANHDFGLRFFPRNQVRIPDMELMPAE